VKHCRFKIAIKLALAFLYAFTLISTASASPFDVELFSKPIGSFRLGSDQKTFGKLEFIGGIEFTSSNAHVGALSGMVLIKERSQILAVTDTGYWFTANIKRSLSGVPLALDSGRMAPILNRSGNPYQHKWDADAESIIIDGDTALIAFERDNRVLRYKLDLENFASLPERIKLNIDVTKLRGNKGLETILKAPANGPLKGAYIVISERSYAKKKRIKAAILSGPGKGLFTVKRKGKFDITDGDFLPNGDLILLERRFNLANGIGMRLRRIKADKIKPGANLKGKTLLLADGGDQIDNMEGLSITTDDAGHIYLSLISDDNHSMLQRNLYLEFKLISGD
jgi:hypothetical protein